MRRVLFWFHLVAGLVAGLVIAILCFTGTALAFEKQLVAWAERDARLVAVSAGATRLPLAELARRIQIDHPEVRPTAIVVAAAPDAAVAFQLGRERTLYADPYTGAIRTPASTQLHAFLHSMETWHRWLALGGDRRPLGKAITGAANAAFLLLALTGLYLWWPRTWSWRGLRAIAILNLRLGGKARDWNWHHALGLWSAPILIVLTLTALPISYRWATNLLYTATGTEPAAQAAGPGAQVPSPSVSQPAPDARPLALDDLLAAVAAARPDWTELTFRLSAPGRRSTPGAVPSGAPSEAAASNAGPLSAVPLVQAQAVALRHAGQFPRFAATTLHLDPFTGAVLRADTFSGLPAGRRLRSWARFLHTGEALGWPGQLIAAFATTAGLVLVGTGLALAWRRFFHRAGA